MTATPFTEDDIARLLADTAGMTVVLESDSVFEELGVDSLAVLGLVQAIESERGIALPESAEKAVTIREFLDTVNTRLT
jgi:minimal PKS acyl carrier protein